MTVYLVISLPPIPYTHRIYKVLANPKNLALLARLRRTPWHCHTGTNMQDCAECCSWHSIWHCKLNCEGRSGIVTQAQTYKIVLNAALGIVSGTDSQIAKDALTVSPPDNGP